MDRNIRKGIMDQQKNHEQIRYNRTESGIETPEFANQRFLHDPSSNINTNIRPPDHNMSTGARPVLNYSIQTGEEFAMEFMRERVNPMQHFVHNASIPGFSHRGSENSYDISMLNTEEKPHPQEFEGKAPSVYEEKSFYDSMRSVSQSSSRNGISLVQHGYSSTNASLSSSTKVKFLCSFGGKVLPRPSDRELRYVGGETRIIQLSKGISFQELVQKTLGIYNQAHVIKYQLPGEDLDALVSVSCDEDLQHMMDECNGGSQKPRIFLFSSNDLEDAPYGSGSVEGDSEIQYVVAVNGMDLGSRKNSIASSLSENKLDGLLGLNAVREAGQIVSEAVVTSSSFTTNAPSVTVQSSQPVLASSSSTYVSSTQPYSEQKVCHGEGSQQLSSTFQVDGKTSVPLRAALQYGHGSQPSNCVMHGESSVSMAFHGHVTPEIAAKDFQVHGPEVSIKEVKIKGDGSAPKITEPEEVLSLDKVPPTKKSKMKRETSLSKINETEKVWMSEKEYNSPSNAYDNSSASLISSEQAFISVPDSGTPLLPAKNFKKAQETMQNLVPPEVATEGRKNVEDGFRCLESSVIPQQVFYSERIPREQTEMIRLSKSDDSFDSQFLMTQAHSDSSQVIREEVDKIHDGNSSPQADQSVTSANPRFENPRTVMGGRAEFENSKGYSQNVISNISVERLESTEQKSELKRVSVKSTANEAAARLNHPTASQRTSVRHLEEPYLKPSEFERIEKDENKKPGNHAKGNGQSLVRAEDPIRPTSNVQPAASISTSEHGDILIDINDRFPPDLMSDIFSQLRMSQNPQDIISPFPGDGAVLSSNMENLEPRHLSHFCNLAQDAFVRKDVSLMDQDHLGFSSPLTNIEGGAPADYSYPPLKSAGTVTLAQIKSDINFAEGIRQGSSTVANNLDIGLDYKKSPVDADESAGVGQILQVPEFEIEDGKLDILNTGLPLVDHSHGEIDTSTLQIIKNKDLEELRELGSGTFGTVYHGKWRGTEVAIKRIKKICFAGRSSEQERLTVEFWREADILSKLHHPNVLAFYGVVRDGPGGTLATVTEFMVNGSLRHVLLRKERQIDRRKRLIIAMDAAFGMEYLHSKNIVHFDLKCDNLLVNLRDPIRPICKVGDFGLSKIKRNTLITGGVRGTLPWMAPELLNGSSSKVSEKVDVFSFGIVLWEILTGDEPYANMHYGAIIGGIVSNTLRPPVPSFCDPEWKLLMEQCWAPDPVVRPSFTEIARRLSIMLSACPSKPQGHHKLQNQACK